MTLQEASPARRTASEYIDGYEVDVSPPLPDLRDYYRQRCREFDGTLTDLLEDCGIPPALRIDGNRDDRFWGNIDPDLAVIPFKLPREVQNQYLGQGVPQDPRYHDVLNKAVLHNGQTQLKDTDRVIIVGLRSKHHSREWDLKLVRERDLRMSEDELDNFAFHALTNDEQELFDNARILKGLMDSDS